MALSAERATGRQGGAQVVDGGDFKDEVQRVDALEASILRVGAGDLRAKNYPRVVRVGGECRCNRAM